MPTYHTDPQVLERYRPLIDDWGAFCEALGRPLPTVLWANPLRIAAPGLRALLEAEGLRPEPLHWCGEAFRLPPDTPVGTQWWYMAGLAHSQEEVSMLPVHLLAPRPGERVLDLCAAPGGKTAQIAVALGNRGTVVANDISVARTKPLRATLERLGLVNVSTTTEDGANYPAQAGPFDRVLVDAPCSGEGTWRRRAGLRGQTGRAVSLERSRVQRALLRKAVQLCRVGGRIVYSTCTFAPEENELVVNSILNELGEAVDVIDVATPEFAASPGITRWDGERLQPALARTLRLWPHHNDTGGFFVAVLERRGDDRQPRPDIHGPERSQDTTWWPALRDRFGLPETLWNELIACRQNGRGLHVVHRAHQPPPRPAPSASGLFFFRTNVQLPKLTTAGAMLLGGYATRNVIELNAAHTAAYLARDTVWLTASAITTCTGGGFVLVRHQGMTLGVGHLNRGTGRLRSLFPKHWNGRR